MLLGLIRNIGQASLSFLAAVGNQPIYIFCCRSISPPFMAAAWRQILDIGFFSLPVVGLQHFSLAWSSPKAIPASLGFQQKTLWQR